MDKVDVISMGDANLDAFIAPQESESLCNLDTKECLIAFSYGDKIPVKSLEFSIGGNAANNVIGLNRLGLNALPVLTLGDDSTGLQIIERLKNEGVNLTFVLQQPSTSSNFNVVVTYSGERTIFSYHSPRSYEFPLQLPKSQFVYLTSMGDSFRPFYNHVVEWLLKNPDTGLVFNPGSVQMREGASNLSSILKMTKIIFVNKQEAEKLSGFNSESQVTRQLAQSLSLLGPKIVIITDGSNGSFAFDGNNLFHCPVLPMDAFERTGAGDAFGSGFLAAFVKGKSIEESLIWGTVNSASVIGYTGAQRGLLSFKDIDVWLDRAKSCGVTVKQI